MAQLFFQNNEILFSSEQIIVSKTDLTGNMTYVNQTFCDVSGYHEVDLLGKPHSLIRHPNMPRCVFKLIWEKVQSGREVFGYVVNRTINDDYYWVFAHVTPSFDSNHQICGYHSNRRVPNKGVISSIIAPFYAELLQIEAKEKNRKDGLNNSYNYLSETIAQKEMDYDEFIFSF